MTMTKSNSKSFVYTGNDGTHDIYTYTYNDDISINLYSAVSYDEESYVTVTYSLGVILHDIEEIITVDEGLITPDMAYKDGERFILGELSEILD